MATAPRKRATKKKAPAKKRAATKKASPPKPNGKGTDKGPLDFNIKSDLMRFKLKSLQLEWEKEDARVRREINQKLNDLLARSQRNDPAWKKANDARLKAADEAIEKLTESLPEGYALKNLQLADGTYRAVYDPESRGKPADR